MAKAFYKLGGTKRASQLEKWKDGDNSTWKLCISNTEVNAQLLKKRRNTEDCLKEHSLKRQKLEIENKELKNVVQKQAKEIAGLKSGTPVTYRQASKSWPEYSRQQKYNIKKQISAQVCSALSFCNENTFRPCKLEMKNVDEGTYEVLDLATGHFESRSDGEVSSDAHTALYLKDKTSISNAGYHELSMISNLPSSYQIKKYTKQMNDQYEIQNSPEGIVGVQQSLKTQLKFVITCLINNGTQLPDTLRVKLTGDGTQIARGFNVINFAFTVLEEGEKAMSVSGNHCLAIVKVSEANDDELFRALKDIIDEAKGLNSVTVEDRIFKIDYYLGGDMKFLAKVCGIEGATSEFSCIWCKCPKDERYNMDLQWSVTDESLGARTVEDIVRRSKLGKRNKERLNCYREPMFDFVPMHHVIIDALHLFLRISDVLINLLIRDIRILDGIKKSNDHTKAVNLNRYVSFLNDECKVRFHFYNDKESKTLKWRDLTGPEKSRLFATINIQSLFPSLHNKAQIHKLWKDFYSLINFLSQTECDATEFDRCSKSWVRLFVSIYQSKDVTPYIHCFGMHVSQFLELYGNIVTFTQQGLEKLNDITTIYFQHSSNHREHQALKQILEKRNRIEEFELTGHKRTIRSLKCSVCGQIGHNKRTCSDNK